MDKVEELKRITREVLGGGIGSNFFRRVDRMLDEGGVTDASLLLAGEKIEILVRLFISEEKAIILGERYRNYLKKNASYL